VRAGAAGDLLVVAFRDTPVRIQWIERTGAIVQEQIVTAPRAGETSSPPEVALMRWWAGQRTTVMRAAYNPQVETGLGALRRALPPDVRVVGSGLWIEDPQRPSVQR
jgi:hypothetical protein